jgi:hypothetical protein
LAKLSLEQKQLISNLFFRLSILADTDPLPTERVVEIEEIIDGQ